MPLVILYRKYTGVGENDFSEMTPPMANHAKQVRVRDVVQEALQRERC
jgi:hypothetical protein